MWQPLASAVIYFVFTTLGYDGVHDDDICINDCVSKIYMPWENRASYHYFPAAWQKREQMKAEEGRE